MRWGSANRNRADTRYICNTGLVERKDETRKEKKRKNIVQLPSQVTYIYPKVTLPKVTNSDPTHPAWWVSTKFYRSSQEMS